MRLRARRPGDRHEVELILHETQFSYAVVADPKPPDFMDYRKVDAIFREADGSVLYWQVDRHTFSIGLRRDDPEHIALVLEFLRRVRAAADPEGATVIEA